ncbi:MAG: alpha/beta hydrolase [Myxococcota bacterium]|nr:alpha/beta hydrolase [Myxococcota bacterium]
MKIRHVERFVRASIPIAAFVLLNSCRGPSAETSQARLVLEPCSHEVEGQEELAELNALCGKYDVWENRKRKEGRKISLNIAVVPALGKAKPDPLFLLSGGPGQAATEDKWFPMFPWVKKLRIHRDIVLVDQRGTGSSNPLDCEPDGGIANVPLKEMFQLRRPIDETADCVKKWDADLHQYTTDVAMDDLNEVREALGYDKINIYGISYGTRAAHVYLRRHENTVRSIVLEGTVPMEMRILDGSAEDGNRAMGLLLDHCERDKNCSEVFPTLRDDLNTLIESLLRSPAKVRLSHPRKGETQEVIIGVESFRMLLFTALYDSITTALIPLAITKAKNGDFSIIATILESRSAVAEVISTGMQKAVLCNEDFIVLDRSEESDGGPRKGVFSRKEMLGIMSQHCDLFEGANLPDTYFEPVRSKVPALVISGELDPVTPPRWGDITAKNLNNARHIVIPGTGHGAINNPCVSKMIVKFVDNASSAGIDTDCLKHFKRFPIFLSETGPMLKKEAR